MHVLHHFPKWALFVVLVFVSALVAGLWAKRIALNEVNVQASGMLSLAATGFRNELEKQRLVPILLADDVDIQNALLNPNERDIQIVNLKLTELAKKSSSTTIYLLNKDGMTIASSNYKDKDSFVGNDFSYRGYYKQTLVHHYYEQFGFGAVSHHAGFYFANLVIKADKVLGIVVAKLEPGALETEWQKSGHLVYLTDDMGVIMMATNPKLRFKSLEPLSPKDMQNEIIRYSPEVSLDLQQMPFKVKSDGLLEFENGVKKERYFAAQQKIEGRADQYHLNVLVNSELYLDKTINQARLMGALVMALVCLTGYWLYRRRLYHFQRQSELANRARELEEGVRERTTALLASNERLHEEIDERERAETRVIQLLEELAQANRLTILGQITAGIAHEINQPLAAIRTYAQNGEKFLQRSQQEKAQENFTTIIGLTNRLASITEGLRNFSRRQRQKATRFDVLQSIDGAFLIVKTPMRQKNIKIEWRPPQNPVYVYGERVPLEQVLVNLLRNAADALEGQKDPLVVLTLETKGKQAYIRVADNGSGISEPTQKELFKPFVSSRSNGLGLGLVISSDIIRDFGGRLTVENGTVLKGAVFTVELPLA